MMRRVSISILFLLMGGVALAQERGSERRNRRVTYRITDVLTGSVDDPNVSLLIERENLTMDYDLALEESFLPRIVESVENSPF